MTRLSVHAEDGSETDAKRITQTTQIAQALQSRGIRFEHTGAAAMQAVRAHIGVHDVGPAVLTAHADLIARQRSVHGYTVVDVVTVSSETPDCATLRRKFLSEHTHDEDEARFMVQGAGQFYLRHDGHVLILELCAGDLISVPAGMRHWFDMGERPSFTAIRFFTRHDGWVGQFTGDAIAERFPLYAGLPA